MVLRGAELGLLTDLYELTMAQCYFQNGMSGRATFSLHVRTAPPDRGYMVCAGLEEVLRYLEEWSFSESDIEYLRSSGIFHQDFLDYLPQVGFTGDVWAISEGRIFFPGEPILEVTGPVMEAQAVETFIINQVHLQSLIATKASRCVSAAQGRVVSDFSLRRTHGVDAGMKVARCSYIGGAVSTSNVLAGKIYGIPPAGTMAHSFVTSFPTEIEAFRAYGRSFPNRSIFLVDTYDTIAGAHQAVVAAKEMEERGDRLFGVRLDSGNFDSLSRAVRAILDDAGLDYVKIVASGGLDEHDVARLSSAGAPIDIFGVGTRMGVSADAPTADMAYKMVSYCGNPVMKLSEGKVSLPAEKQVFRIKDSSGQMTEDIIAGRDEQGLTGEPLLEKVMEGGRIVGSQPTLQQMRERLESDLSSLDGHHKALKSPRIYPVRLSPALERLRQDTEQDLRAKTGALAHEGQR